MKLRTLYPLLSLSFVLCGNSFGADTLAERMESVLFSHFAKSKGYSEGPTWLGGQLYFCSGGLQRVEADGTVTRALDIEPAGTVPTGNGALLICDNKHKALLHWTPGGALEVVADRFDGQPFGSLNDLTVDREGNVYWTDPAGSSRTNPSGSIYRVTTNGLVSRVLTGLAFPNGLDVDPAGRHLWIMESLSKRILRVPLPEKGGEFSKPEVMHQLGGTGSGGDGCAFDADGNLWVAEFQCPETRKGRILVFSPEGKKLAHLDVPAGYSSNVTFGGPANDEIFVTTWEPGGVFRARVPAKGFPGHRFRPSRLLRPMVSGQ